MPMEITAFKAGDGSLHEDRCTAATKDIELLIGRSPLAENQPYARKVLEWLTDDPDTIMDAMKEFQVACPKASQEQPPSEKPRRTRSSERTLADGD